MDKEFLENYNYILSYISPRIREFLKQLGDKALDNLQEIRLRKNKPIVIVTTDGSSFLTNTSKLTYIYSKNCVVPSENEIVDTLNKMCCYSVHSHIDTISKGFIVLPNGARIGVIGTAVVDNRNIKTIKDIHSINIRIPRTILNISNYFFEYYINSSLENIIIAGPPNCGKTTLLRDIAYQLSTGKTGKYYKVSIVDERKEIGVSENAVGYNTDVLIGYPKAEGISIALRTLSPEIIICDEIGSKDEVEQLLEHINTGIKFILTVHAKDINELRRKEAFYRLVDKGGFNTVVFLDDSKHPGRITEIYRVVIKENDFIFNCNSDKYNCGCLLNRAN